MHHPTDPRKVAKVRAQSSAASRPGGSGGFHFMNITPFGAAHAAPPEDDGRPGGG